MKKKQKLTEKEKYTKNCREIYLIMCGITGALLGLGVLAAIGSIGSAVEGNINTAASILTAVKLLTLLIAVNHIRAMFKRLSVLDAPFAYDIADKLKGASMALIGGGVVYFIILAAVCLIIPKGTISDLTGENGAFGFVVLVLGYILSALSFIFSYGAKLQQESDDTV